MKKPKFNFFQRVQAVIAVPPGEYQVHLFASSDDGRLEADVSLDDPLYIYVQEGGATEFDVALAAEIPASAWENIKRGIK